MSEATLRQWSTHEFKPYGCRIYAPDCYIIASTSSGLNEDWVVPNPLGDSGAKANAELIVRAVNSFDDLLAACKAAVLDAEKASNPAARLYGYREFKLAIAKAEGQ